VENAGKVSQQDAACLGLGWLYPGPVDRCWTTGSRDKPVCCLWVTKLQSNTVLKLKVFLQKVIKCSFLVFMTLFSSKELHFPTNNRELNYMVDSSINIRGTIVRKQRHCWKCKYIELIFLSQKGRGLKEKKETNKKNPDIEPGVLNCMIDCTHFHLHQVLLLGCSFTCKLL
jgi:hypothetical protein